MSMQATVPVTGGGAATPTVDESSSRCDGQIARSQQRMFFWMRRASQKNHSLMIRGCVCVCVLRSAIASSRKRLRNNHQGSGGVEENEEAQREEADAAAPPATRLYRHALESIFGFLSLADLSRVTAVTRAWSAAVDSMCRIYAAVEQFPLAAGTSRLARHVGIIGSEVVPVAFHQDEMQLACSRLSGLHTLHWRLLSHLASSPQLPPSLTALTIDALEASAWAANYCAATASRLPKLISLTLSNSSLFSFVPFQLDSAAPLHTLSLDEDLSDRQAVELRGMAHLTALDVILKAPVMRVLLREPHQLQLQDLRVLWSLDDDDELTKLLASLSHLTKLEVHCAGTLTFLNSLPSLRALELVGFAEKIPVFWQPPLPPPPEQICHGLNQCALLNTFTLRNINLTSAHMSALLSLMPLLSDLRLVNMRSMTLDFLSTGAVARTLTHLTLKSCHLAVCSLRIQDIFLLQQLTSLELCNCMSAAASDPVTLRELEVPSARLPKLVRSVVKFTI